MTAFLLTSGASPCLIGALSAVVYAAGRGLFLHRMESARRDVGVLAGLEGLGGGGVRRTALAVLMVGTAALLALAAVHAGLAVRVQGSGGQAPSGRHTRPTG